METIRRKLINDEAHLKAHAVLVPPWAEGKA